MTGISLASLLSDQLRSASHSPPALVRGPSGPGPMIDERGNMTSQKVWQPVSGTSPQILHRSRCSPQNTTKFFFWFPKLLNSQPSVTAWPAQITSRVSRLSPAPFTSADRKGSSESRSGVQEYLTFGPFIPTPIIISTAAALAQAVHARKITLHRRALSLGLWLNWSVRGGSAALWIRSPFLLAPAPTESGHPSSSLSNNRCSCLQHGRLSSPTLKEVWT